MEHDKQQQNDNFNIQINEQKKVDDIEHRLHQYQCVICLEVAKLPIVTPCGHLFCWVCIYSWLNQNHEFLTCPVCKNGISQKDLVPVYANNTRQSKEEEEQQLLDSNANPIPCRPQPKKRQTPQRNRNAIGEDGNFINMRQGLNLQQGIILAGYGYFPSAFNLMFTVGNKIDDRDMENISPEVQYKKQFKILMLIMLIVVLYIFFACF